MLSVSTPRKRRGSIGMGKLSVSMPAYVVDAFTEEHFSGNPAAVCLVEGVQVTRAKTHTRILIRFAGR